MRSAALGLGLAAALASSCAAPAAPAALSALAAPVQQRPAYCVEAQPGALQEIAGTPASPYLVRQPPNGATLTGTVVFLPGGAAIRRNAERIWAAVLSSAKDSDRFRVVIPYFPEAEIEEDFRRTLAITDEVLACYGAADRAVHLAGFSKGGQAAFDLMRERPERFATLLGAPGEFALGTKPADLVKLKGKAVFNGVGELDDESWHEAVRHAHDLLVSAGVDSQYVEFSGQRHSAGAGFPSDLLFKFWLEHSATPPR